ncbi:NAD(P)/FAD-dependent oxidoreductase [Leptospirillum ferrooxidans]|uniref:NADH:ubiquinone reductase (non-electrogenic) n=1 Tax=Leptospirillum ferrooxidans (strain C2-3) TaxID=1162668 RepID=I0IQP1_LEPFC|nr:NAD(P)/FAD-dependent oxidoreductase [Leptospirillum ferrooxidans]BAM07590.1 NADH dehydrogenase [Leptospirillum ferrooxidans C2-3]
MSENLEKTTSNGAGDAMLQNVGVKKEPDPAVQPHRILVLGSGFGGLYTAVYLDRYLKGLPDVRITVIDKHNFFLFTPMLHAAATGGLEPRYIAHSIRKIFRKTRIHAHIGEVLSIDLEKKTVSTQHRTMAYDDLVISLGSRTNFMNLEDRLEGVFTLKSLKDAAVINNHVIRMFEKAYWEDDPEIRKSYLTFVVVGGGPTGVELAGELHEYATRELLRDFGRRIDKSEIRVILVEATSRILPMLPPNLSLEALERLRSIGIDVLLETRLEGYQNQKVQLVGGDEIPSTTLVWAAGVKTNPLVAALDLEKDGIGRIKVNGTLESTKKPHVWVVGDNAHSMNPHSGMPYPPTAQTAVRQAKVCAHNIVARLRKRPEKLFSHEHVGGFVSIGDNYALLSAKQLTLTGMVGWFLWNLVYIHKLPIIRYRLLSTFSLFLKVFFERATTEIDLTPDPVENPSPEYQRALQEDY